MAEKLSGTQPLLDSLLIGELYELVRQYLFREKGRLGLCLVAAFGLYITAEALRLTVGFTLTRPLLVLILWLLAVLIFKLPGAVTLVVGLLSLLCLPAAIIFDYPSYLEPFSLLAFWLLVIGTVQVGAESGGGKTQLTENGGTDEIKPQPPENS